jgi:integrase
MTNKRRAHGEGSISARGKNKWRIRYDAPIGESARKQVSETVTGPKSKALSVLREKIRSLEIGRFVGPSQQTVDQYLKRWLRQHAENVSPKTAEGYASMIRNYVVPVIGHVRLQRLESHHLSTLYAEMSEKNLSSSTRAHCHRTLRKALGDALKQNLINNNPALGVTPPRQRRREPKTWSVTEFRRFIEAAKGDVFRNFFEFAALTGMRRSEITGLKWTQVDVDLGNLRVTETLQRIGGRGLVVSTPKTRGSRRVIALSGRTIELLKEVRRDQLELHLATGSAFNDTGYVFTDRLGQPYDSGRPTKHFLNITRQVGLPIQSLHSLRHFHASVLMASGTHIKVVSERLGHSSVAFTMDVYGHLMPGMQEQAALVIDQALAAE